MAASGWLTSCAIDAVSSPSVVSRETCASSASATASASSARFASLMSPSATTTIGVPAGPFTARADSRTQITLPSLRTLRSSHLID